MKRDLHKFLLYLSKKKKKRSAPVFRSDSRGPWGVAKPPAWEPRLESKPKLMNLLLSRGGNKETTAVSLRSLGISVSNAARIESLKLFDLGTGYKLDNI